MKSYLKILVFFAFMAVCSSCGKNSDPVPVSVSVGANPGGGIWISFQFGYRPGGYSGGYYYPNGYPSNWGQDFLFVGYVHGSPIGNTTRPVFTADGKPMIGPNGLLVATNINPSMMGYLNHFSDTTLVPVLVTMRKDLSDNWDYVLRKKKNKKYIDISDSAKYTVLYIKEF